jgi:hypothetical protein
MQAGLEIIVGILWKQQDQLLFHLLANTTYTVTDGVTCLTDVFNITVSGAGRNLITNATIEATSNGIGKSNSDFGA